MATAAQAEVFRRAIDIVTSQAASSFQPQMAEFQALLNDPSDGNVIVDRIVDELHGTLHGAATRRAYDKGFDDGHSEALASAGDYDLGFDAGYRDAVDDIRSLKTPTVQKGQTNEQ